MNASFVAQVTPPDTLLDPAYWFIFRGYKLLVELSGDTVRAPRLHGLAELGVTAVRQQYLGYTETSPPTHVYSAELTKETQPPDGWRFMNLRKLFGRLDDECFWLAGRAIQIMDWDRTHQFCGKCGQPTETQGHERAKKCPQCNHTSYPRLNPAMIVRVTRQGENGPEILLARTHRFPPGRYSVLAGFVEPGETLEDCVRREVCEEVGVKVKNIRYFGSQPWPFPNSLMLGFTAEYESGEIVLEEEEMDDAGWYTPDNMPEIPPRISIANRLINDFLDQNR
ncbi:MAG: NAD(+) diphosphatase [Chloroflexi bacterium]|nr:NAD(+) diphosphatase [Chloroflexota bacterium]